MTNFLDTLYAELKREADRRGLVVFEAIPDVSQVPNVPWTGDWRAFVELAHRSQVTLFYTELLPYDPDAPVEAIIRHEIESYRLRESELDDDEEEEEVDEEEEPSRNGAVSWFRSRLHEAIAPWDSHRGESRVVNALWIKDGVAHEWEMEAEWLPAQRAALADAFVSAQAVARPDRVLRSQEAAVKLHGLARQLANHPRFSEASSHEKRSFMAGQLFAETLKDPSVSLGITPWEIARRAALVYWWEVEPVERTTVAQRAKELRARGESIRNIAASLKISEAKVRTAIHDED